MRNDRNPKRVVVLGKGTMAIHAGAFFLERPAEYSLEAVVPVVPEPAWDESFMAWAEREKVPVVASGDWRDVLGTTWDLGFSCFYDKIVKRELISSCDRLLNIHAAPLPRYRGVRPINWALLNGEREHGATIHEIDEGIDSGPIVAQVKFSIYPEFDEVRDVYARMLRYGRQLFDETMPILDQIEAVPQDDSMALTYTHKQDDLLGERADWTR